MRGRATVCAGLAALALAGPAAAGQSDVSAYIQQAFGKLPQTDCRGVRGAFRCAVPVVVAANTLHQGGATSFNSPPSGAVRYCAASTTYLGAPIFGFVASGSQLRSETLPAFADERLTCQLNFNLNDDTMSFIGPKVGAVAPTVVYHLQVLNGMLVGATPGFTAVVVFGTPSAIPVLK